MAPAVPQSPTHSVGPEYVSEKEKPTATVSTEVNFKTVHVLQQSPQLIALLTSVIRTLVGDYSPADCLSE